MGTADASVRLHPIQVASRRSGLRPDVLRAWERRHGAVVPQRTASGRRLYSDEDVERLRMLGALTRAGHRFSDGAAHPESVLVQLLDPAGSGSSPSPATEGVPEGLLVRALDAVEAMDGDPLCR